MELRSTIASIVGEDNILINEKMDSHTTFKVGGVCKYYVTPCDVQQIQDLIKLFSDNEISYLILGNGSNVLVSDSGYDGAIICLARNMTNIVVKGTSVNAQAGVMLPVLATTVARMGLSGLEFAQGIPGSVGGACVMNAGAYGSELANVLVKVTAIDSSGVVREFSVKEIEAGYRHTIFCNGGYTIISADFELATGDISEIRSRMEDYAMRRRDKQPLNYASAGSTFKRPEGYFAGQLIEDAGLKGYGHGAACVSEKHAGFVINKGGATASDVYSTIVDIQRIVKDKFGVQLETEVCMVGKFS